MDFIGKWIFNSVGVVGEDGAMTYMSGKEYLDSPLIGIDGTDPEAVASEMNDRKMIIGSCVRIDADGKLYILLPLPEEATKEEIEEAVTSGELNLIDGMMATNAMSWEIRDGKLWYDTGIEGEVFGEKADTRTCAIDENGYFTFITTRYEKEEK